MVIVPLVDVHVRFVVTVVVIDVEPRGLRPYVVVHSLGVLHGRLHRQELTFRILDFAHRGFPSAPQFINLSSVRLHGSLQGVEVRRGFVFLDGRRRRGCFEPFLGRR